MFSNSIKRKTTIPALLLSVIAVFAALLLFSLHASAGEMGDEIRDLGFQSITSDTVEDDSTSLRFLFTVGSLDYTRAGFVFSKTNQNPTVGGADCHLYETTTVHATVWANGVENHAPDGRHWVAVEMTGIPNGAFDTPIYLNAFVEDGEGIRYATAKSVTVWQAFGIEKIADDLVPILRFAVFSDAHFGETANAQDQKLHDLIEGAYDYSDNHAKYQALDGVFAVGDIADRGKTTELNRFFSAFYEYVRQGTEAQAVLGNHEFYTQPANTVSRYLAASGYESADRHITISGYHFILMSPSEYEGFNDAKITWLSEQLAIAAADDPTGKKPIFVFQHHPAFDTVYGSEDEWGVANLEPVFSLYPQVVDFSGHSHFPINDPRSIWQGSYTELNTGSCREWGMDLAGVTSETVFALGQEGNWSYSEGAGELYDPGKYYVVEVNAASRVLIRAFDVGTGVEVMEPIFLASVGNVSRFAYTDDRAYEEETPRFAANAEVETVALNDSSVSLRFPRTASGAYVQHYRCELRQGETLVQTVLRLDCGFLFPAPETLTLQFTGLSADTAYTVSIIPVTAWANDGEPLVFNFTTSGYSTIVFSARFGQNGAATDGVSGAALTKRGDPTTVYDGTRDAYYAVFDGDDAFEFYGISPYYSALTHAFTFETYLCMDAKPASSYVSPFSNQESGGFGFEYNSEGQMNFWIFASANWISAHAAIETGNWVHLVATFDGSVLILYENGVEVNRTDVSGTPALPNADHLSIGADSKGNNGSERYASCKIATANVYRITLSASDVADLYAAYAD